VNTVTEAEKEKNRGKRRAHRRSSAGGGTAASSQKKIQLPPVQCGRGAAAAVPSAKVSDVVERRRRCGAGQRRCGFSVLSVRRWSARDRGTEEEDDGVG
jgi:hypothetical protein